MDRTIEKKIERLDSELVSMSRDDIDIKFVKKIIGAGSKTYLGTCSQDVFSVIPLYDTVIVNNSHLRKLYRELKTDELASLIEKKQIIPAFDFLNYKKSKDVYHMHMLPPNEIGEMILENSLDFLTAKMIDFYTLEYFKEKDLVNEKEIYKISKLLGVCPFQWEEILKLKPFIRFIYCSETVISENKELMKCLFCNIREFVRNSALESTQIAQNICPNIEHFKIQMIEKQSLETSSFFSIDEIYDLDLILKNLNVAYSPNIPIMDYLEIVNKTKLRNIVQNMVLGENTNSIEIQRRLNQFNNEINDISRSYRTKLLFGTSSFLKKNKESIGSLLMFSALSSIMGMTAAIPIVGGLVGLSVKKKLDIEILEIPEEWKQLTKEVHSWLDDKTEGLQSLLVGTGTDALHIYKTQKKLKSLKYS